MAGSALHFLSISTASEATTGLATPSIGQVQTARVQEAGDIPGACHPLKRRDASERGTRTLITLCGILLHGDAEAVDEISPLPGEHSCPAPQTSARVSVKRPAAGFCEFHPPPPRPPFNEALGFPW